MSPSQRGLPSDQAQDEVASIPGFLRSCRCPLSSPGWSQAPWVVVIVGGNMEGVQTATMWETVHQWMSTQHPLLGVRRSVQNWPGMSCDDTLLLDEDTGLWAKLTRWLVAHHR